MQLTKLEIKGFKSFGDKVVIHFDQGITGIVGPNGCGKSNVVDAIRWVLGEQKTRALRSDKMENVIFNGTKTRKPTQMAEVSLTFDNTRNLLPTEYAQVTITRRYYRSGESEYELNGVQCRLKDITGLFMDTGIASNSYAIIELKMVDEILNDKEGSRRALFEEAAGISKFKSRKKESLKKLEDTAADLERVEDLLFEIEKNLKSLERQAKQTERYFNLKAEYKEGSIRLARKSISKYTDQFLLLQKQIEEEKDRKANLDARLAEKDALIEEAKAGMITKEKLLVTRQKTLNEHVNTIRQQESDKKIKNERLRFLTDKRDNLKEQLELDRQSNERASFSILSLQQEQQSAEKVLAESKALLDELREALDEQKDQTNTIREEAQLANQQYRQLQDQSYQQSKALEIKQMQLSSLKQEHEKAARDSSEQSSSLAIFDEKMEDLREQLQEKEESLEQLRSHEEALQERIIELEETISRQKDQIAQNGRQLDSRQNEYNLTKSLVDNLEGFPEAIRFLKKKTGWGQNIPLLSDIVSCEDRYKVAIENYLEPYMNYYVVDTATQAHEAVELLHEAARGRAHFFILDSLKSFKPGTTNGQNGSTPAKEIIEFDRKYQPLINFLFNEVYLTDEAQVQQVEENTGTYISLSGKVIRRNHSLSGGSLGMFEGKRIGRAKNLEKLKNEIQQLEEEQQKLSREQEKMAQELSSIKGSTQKAAIEQHQRGLNNLQQEFVSVRTQQEQMARMLSNHATRQEDIEAKIADLQEEIIDLQPQASEAATQLQSLEGKIAHFNEELQLQNEALQLKYSRFNEQNILFHQQENRLNSLVQEIGFKQTAYESSQQRISKNKLQLEESEGEINALLEKNEIGDEELLDMYREKENIEKAVNEAEQEYYQSRGLIDTHEKESRELQRQRESSQSLMMELQNRQNEYKLQLSSIKERLSVEFEIDAEQLMEEEQEAETATEEQLKEMVRSAREKLDRIGPINPMAMEAYEEIKERHTFISEQKKDLLEAKGSLMNTIEQLDTAAREAFLTAFYQIKENFIKVFRSLFTEEDDCDLKLTDPENPLESAIEIMAKPKGKRPLTINQLSGGEKTLTATSLLFSIYLLKPAPFCIFDEVDAPLDDANIDKFNNIIRKFSKDSQFIIVTHNKRTMASTDIMYGVTMLEMGVSRVVPVDLRGLVIEE
ncbi:chromosome segregation protein SMC [Nafulsella turpanensis]|uniref:chromosome segregation protein SMC n=1 Tax=Nafulsella turpanensis TaxID=1265690 RepID=UPI000345651A|nr:chromosome segregation protein SMC [Nafulsella turpanensis]